MAFVAPATASNGVHTVPGVSAGEPSPTNNALAKRTGHAASAALDDTPEVTNCYRSSCCRVNYATSKRPRSRSCTAEFSWPCSLALIGVIAAVVYRIIHNS
jgi:hypothetical protein